tara:strand:+ start:1227 stop:2438 length:1212 start_codon:yes stop_codon:yes gene_type:complete
MLNGKRILLVISGGIAAYKSLDLIRHLREQGVLVRCVLTKAATKFITPLSVSVLSEEKVFSDLFSLTDENEMGHIQLSRESDLIVIAPATANILSSMAQGVADDLATTVLLAANKTIMAAPSMNVRMWEHEATINNLKILRNRGIQIIGPESGDMACGEFGMGRMTEPDEILSEIQLYFSNEDRLSGVQAIVTSGPTQEPIDPVRFIANRSSGKQGHAIASTLAKFGAETTLVTGPTQEPDPAGVNVIHVETAEQMLEACKNSLPADIAVCAAAVSDWRSREEREGKIKKKGNTLSLSFKKTPDILKILAKKGDGRPKLVIGFAAETGDVISKASPKRIEKNCDWILGNDVSMGSNTFGGNKNRVHFIDNAGTESWPEMSKTNVAYELVKRIADYLHPPAEKK